MPCGMKHKCMKENYVDPEPLEIVPNGAINPDLIDLKTRKKLPRKRKADLAIITKRLVC